MSARPLPLAAIAAAASFALLPLSASAAHAPRTVPLKLDFQLTPAQIDASCKTELANAGKRIDAILHARSARTFKTVAEPLENVLSDITDDLAAQTMLFQVSTDKAVRDASQKCTDAVSAFNAELFGRGDLYAALSATAKSRTAHGAAQNKLLELHLVAARRAGAGLPPVQRQRFVDLAKQIAELETRFEANLGNTPAVITLTKEQTDGLQPDLVASLKTDTDGRLVVPTNESTYNQFMSNATDAAARKAFYISFNQRGGIANVALLEQAIALRDESAKLLGYANWAEYALADRMAGTPQRVDSFLIRIDTALKPLAAEQRAKLSALKGSRLEEWDRPYYAKKARQQQFDLDPEVVRQYFPAQHTIDAVLAIYSDMLGLTFTRSDDLPTWHPDVVGYRVMDTASGADRGVFYLDLYPRPGKYGHFANIGPTSRRALPDGMIRPAVNAIVGNWPVPAPGKPSLLSHDDVITFFHEFGHNVAALCGDSPYETLNNGYRLDFVEAPSQMLENFVWDPVILKKISANAAGEPLPDALIAKMNAARHFDEAWLEVGTTIFYSLVDQRIHSARPPVDTSAIWREGKAAWTVDDFVEGTYRQAGIDHFMGGYEGGIYAYPWAKVYAMDMFTAFQKEGLQNREVGMRYRKEILAPARTVEPDVLVQRFLGRPMKPDAFYADLGMRVDAK